MDGFRIFIETEEEENVKDTISKLPKSHQKLLDGYKFKFTPGNTLKGDKEHIGYIHNDKIVVAAPWHYGRGFTTLHEIAHLVWEKLLTPEIKKKWGKLFMQEKKKMPKNSALNQIAEEIFCMAYAATYCKHPPVTYTNDKWQTFIKHLP